MNRCKLMTLNMIKHTVRRNYAILRLTSGGCDFFQKPVSINREIIKKHGYFAVSLTAAALCL